MVDFERARRAMIDSQLRTGNITDRRLLSVMGQVPRELFVPQGRQAVAYIDDSQPLAAKRFMPSPAPFAKLVQLAAITDADNVLDIGAGTGYSTAVLAGLAASVTGVEEDAALVSQANANLSQLGVANARVIAASLVTGGAGTFDVVILEGAVDAVPEALFARLKDGGRLIVLIRQGATAVAHVYAKAGFDVAGRAEFNLSMPPLATNQSAPEFVF